MLKVLWQDSGWAARHADTVAEMKAKVREGCGAMAEEYVRSAAANEAVGIFRRTDHPVINMLNRKPKIMPRMLEETCEAIRSQFGL